MSDLTIDAKQQFLYDEIILQNYPAEEFTTFISKESLNGLDVSNTSFLELQRLVTKFKSLHKPSSTQQNQHEHGFSFQQESHQQQQQQQTQKQNPLDLQDCSHYEQKYTKKFLKQEFGITQPENPATQSTQATSSAGEGDQSTVVGTATTATGTAQFQQNQQQQQSTDKTIPYENNSIIISKYGLAEPNYSREIECYKEIPLINMYSKVSIEVSEAQKVQGGLFGLTAGYLTYKLSVKPHNWEVRRKNLDFNTIREILQRCFPGKILPPLKNKRTISSDKQGIDKQMKYLTMFLYDLQSDAELWANEYLISFLSERSDDKFNKKMKESEKIQASRNFKTHSNFDGRIKLLLSNSSYCFAEEATKFVETSHPIYLKIKSQCHTLKKDFEKASETMFNLGESFHQLYSSFNDFDHKIIDKREENTKLKDCYLNMNNLMMTWGNLMTHQVKQVNEKMSSLFNYAEAEIDTFKNHLRIFAEDEGAYFKYKTRLIAKKEKLFSLGDISKWEIGPNVQYQPDSIANNKQLAFKIMCTKETIYENHLRDQLAFTCSSIYDNMSKGFLKKSNDYEIFFGKFGKAQNDNIEEITSLWKELRIQYKDAAEQAGDRKCDEDLSQKKEPSKLLTAKFY